MENEKNVGTENKTEGGNSLTVTEKKSLKEKIIGMVNEFNQERAAIYELNAAILKESDKEKKNTLKGELKAHRKTYRILKLKLLAIPVGTLAALGLVAMVVGSLKGKKKVVDTNYEEVEEESEEIEDDYEDDESDEDSDDDSVEE